MWETLKANKRHRHLTLKEIITQRVWISLWGSKQRFWKSIPFSLLPYLTFSTSFKAQQGARTTYSSLFVSLKYCVLCNRRFYTTRKNALAWISCLWVTSVLHPTESVGCLQFIVVSLSSTLNPFVCIVMNKCIFNINTDQRQKKTKQYEWQWH